MTSEPLEYDNQSTLSGWFRADPGRHLAEQVQASMSRRLTCTFGYFLVQVGAPTPWMDLLESSRIKHKILMDVLPVSTESSAFVRGDCRYLPMAADSVDAVVLHHAIDFSAEPHQVLREAERILIPEGRIFIVGFNPWSLCGAKRLLHWRKSVAPWSGHFFSSRRIADWLILLGFALEDIELLPSRRRDQQAQQSTGGGLSFNRFGGCLYVIEAVKRSVTMTPVTPKWKLRKKVLPAAVEPTTRAGRDAMG